MIRLLKKYVDSLYRKLLCGNNCEEIASETNMKQRTYSLHRQQRFAFCCFCNHQCKIFASKEQSQACSRYLELEI